MKIVLASNGIFPIIYDKNKNLLPGALDTGYSFQGTCQGEGKLIGTPCIFIRTSSCNLRCAWIGEDGKGSPCDTPYTSHSPQKNIQEIEDVVATIKVNTEDTNIRHVIVSGGEPTLQTEALAELLKGLQNLGLHTTIETNATIFDENIARYTNLISMSPKLSSSTPWQANLKDTGIEYSEKWAQTHEKKRKNIEVVQQYIDSCNGSRTTTNDFQLKFVVSNLQDLSEIESDFVQHLKYINSTDVCLMPEGVTVEDLMKKSSWVAGEAIKRGYRFTPRLHALLWGVRIGV